MYADVHAKYKPRAAKVKRKAAAREAYRHGRPPQAVIRLSAKGEEMVRLSFECIESRFAERIKEVSEEELKEIERALELLHHKVFY